MKKRMKKKKHVSNVVLSTLIWHTRLAVAFCVATTHSAVNPFSPRSNRNSRMGQKHCVLAHPKSFLLVLFCVCVCLCPVLQSYTINIVRHLATFEHYKPINSCSRLGIDIVFFCLFVCLMQRHFTLEVVGDYNSRWQRQQTTNDEFRIDS